MNDLGSAMPPLTFKNDILVDSFLLLVAAGMTYVIYAELPYRHIVLKGKLLLNRKNYY